MGYVLAPILAFVIVFGLIALAMVFGNWLGSKNHVHKQEDYMTKTGETFLERKSYHDRGELSPGEHEMARLIRERLQELPPK